MPKTTVEPPDKKKLEPAIIGPLRKAMQDSGLNMRELAMAAEVTDGSLYRFMKGERSLSLATAEAVARHLGLKLG